MPAGWGGEVEWDGTGVVIGTGPSSAKTASSRMAKLVAVLWYAPSPSDQRMLDRSDISVERMTWNGLRYVRIWSLRAPARGSPGGGFDLPIEMIEQLAAAANTIHIRIKGDENQSVTLKPGVEWCAIAPAQGPFHAALRMPHARCVLRLEQAAAAAASWHAL